MDNPDLNTANDAALAPPAAPSNKPDPDPVDDAAMNQTCAEGVEKQSHTASDEEVEL